MKKNWKFRQNLMILSKMQSYQDIFFLWKKIKTLFRNRICHKILKFSSKIRQIRDLQRRTTSKNQCECFFVFFVFRKNIYTQRVFWIFFSKKAKNTRKSVLNWSKSPRFKHFEHVYNVSYKQESTWWFSKVFVCFHKIVILKGFSW